MMTEMRRPARRRLGHALAVAILFLNAIITHSNLRTLLGNWHALTDAHEVLVVLEAVLSDLRDAETGQRGFLLTGGEGYLEPYWRAVAVVDGDIDRLESLTEHDPARRHRVSRIRSKVAEKLAGLRESTNTLRLATGAIAGLCFGMWVLCAVERNRHKTLTLS